MLKLIYNIEFDDNVFKCNFQRILYIDIEIKIKKLNNLFIFVDKIINYYLMNIVIYEKLIIENVMKIYKKLCFKVID